MIRKLLPLIAGLMLASFLTACGSIQSAAQSLFVPCPGIGYDTVVWSPDGQHLAFTAEQLVGKTDWDLYIMNPDGTNLQRIASNPRGIVELQWLPTSQTLAYTDRAAVFTVDLSGAVSELVHPEAGVWDVAFSPDGKTAAYSQFVIHAGSTLNFEYTGINLANADGGDITHLLTSRDGSPDWSPDGVRIAYVHEGKQSIVYTIRADGGDQRELVRDGLGPVRWSPNGQWIAFVSSLNHTLHVIKPDGSDEKEIAGALAYDEYAWLPDSQHISFGSMWDWQLKVIDLSTLSSEMLAVFDFSESPPSWSPDGSQVAFIATLHSNSLPHPLDIYVVNRDGTGLTRLTDNPARHQCLHWPF